MNVILLHCGNCNAGPMTIAALNQHRCPPAETESEIEALRAALAERTAAVERLREAIIVASDQKQGKGTIQAVLYFWAKGVEPNPDWSPAACELWAALAADREGAD